MGVRRRFGVSRAGFLNVLKPPGMTSHGVVAFVRRLGGARVGHLGTLDPPAAGVLPLALGVATRLQVWLPASRKTYRAEVRFGLETDTLDAVGRVLAERVVEGLTRSRLAEACEVFRGTVLQAPPRVSAIRQGGRRAYERVRRGEDFELPPREAVYHRVRVLEVRPPVALLDVDCGPGTYVRALARDLGQALGCGAVLSFLLRTSSGPFPLEEAWTLEEILEASRAGRLDSCLVTAAQVLERAGLPAVRVGPGPWSGGQEIPAVPVSAGRASGAPLEGMAVRVLDPGHLLVGLGRVSAADPLMVRLDRPLEGVAP